MSIMALSRKRQNKRVKKGFGLGKQIVLGLFILLSVLVFSALYLLDVSARPFEEAKQRATEIALKQVSFRQVTDVTVYNGQETIYAVSGLNEEGKEAYALIPEGNAEIYLYQTSDGISAEEAARRAQEEGAGQIDRILLGYRENRAIWEVKSQTSYFIIDFETGSLVEREGI